MKAINLLFLLSLLILGSCNEPFTGYVVCKEYIPLHMDDEQPKSVQEAIVYVPVVTPKHTPELIKSKFILYIANKNCVIEYEVDSITFIHTKICQKLTLRY
jgi:hypothetical protein